MQDPIFLIPTSEFRYIKEYTGLNFNEIEELPLVKYLFYKRDAWINKQMESEQGREFLKDIRDLQQTTPDYTSLRKVVTHVVK